MLQWIEPSNVDYPLGGFIYSGFDSSSLSTTSSTQVVNDTTATSLTRQSTFSLQVTGQRTTSTWSYWTSYDAQGGTRSQGSYSKELNTSSSEWHASATHSLLTQFRDETSVAEESIIVSVETTTERIIDGSGTRETSFATESFYSSFGRTRYRSTLETTRNPVVTTITGTEQTVNTFIWSTTATFTSSNSSTYETLAEESTLYYGTSTTAVASRTFTSFSTETLTTTGWTFDSNSSLVTTEDTVVWHVSTFTTLDGTDTVTKTVTESTTYTIETTTSLSVFDYGKIPVSVWSNAGCGLLYVANTISDIEAFCDAWSTTESATAMASFDATSSTFVGDTWSSTEFGATQVELNTETDKPNALNTNSEIAIYTPAPEPGFQPFSELAVTDDVYDSFTIQVATTVTNTAEIEERSQGRTFDRGPVTQVLTLHSDDTLSMGSPVGTTSIMGVAGGFGYATGNNTARFDKGVWGITKYGTDGGSTTTISTLNSTTSETFERGEIWATHKYPAYEPGGGWENHQKVAVLEIEC